MEQIKRFLRGKGFALALAACLLAAAAMGVWAVQTIRGELEKEWSGLEDSSSAPGIDEGINETEDADQWEQQTTQAANSVSNAPKPQTASSAPSGAPSASSGASGARSGSGTVYEPRELQTESAPASSSASQAVTQPVSGRILNAFSGDELVYSKTLGDWRTHNGTDFACAEGDAVTSPVAGKVVEAGASGNWGEVIAVQDGEGRVWRLCGVTGQKVKLGETVKAGQTLGKAGIIASECAEESHIHLEVKQGETYLDPAKLVG